MDTHDITSSSLVFQTFRSLYESLVLYWDFISEWNNFLELEECDLPWAPLLNIIFLNLGYSVLEAFHFSTMVIDDLGRATEMF